MLTVSVITKDHLPRLQQMHRYCRPRLNLFTSFQGILELQLATSLQSSWKSFIVILLWSWSATHISDLDFSSVLGLLLLPSQHHNVKLRVTRWTKGWFETSAWVHSDIVQSLHQCSEVVVDPQKLLASGLNSIVSVNQHSVHLLKLLQVVVH